MRVALALVLILAAAPAAAVTRARPGAKPPEPPPVVEEGSRVRVTLLERDAPKVKGWVLALPADSLRLATEPALDSIAIARIDVRKLELSRGMRSNAGRGATIGALIGGVAFGLYVAGLASIEGTAGETWVAGIAGGAVGAIGGAGVGALIGSASKHERWKEVER